MNAGIRSWKTRSNGLPRVRIRGGMWWAGRAGRWRRSRGERPRSELGGARGAAPGGGRARGPAGFPPLSGLPDTAAPPQDGVARVQAEPQIMVTERSLNAVRHANYPTIRPIEPAIS